VKVWIDGRVVEGAEARIPVTDHGLLYGDGVFEGMRVYGGRVFRLDDHLRRFATAARAIGLRLPLDRDAVAKLVLETCRAHAADEAYIRLIATRGVGALGVDPTRCHEPRILCIVDEVRLYPPDKQRDGIDLVTVSLRRPALDSLDPRVKSLNYLNSVLAKQEARLEGADEALILNARGTVAEAAVANVFAVRGDELATPPTTDGSLDGITRASVLEVAPEAGYSTAVRSLSRVDLLGADEVFLTGSGAKIVPVACLDRQPIGFSDRPAGDRPAVRAITAAYDRLTRTRGTPIGS